MIIQVIRGERLATTLSRSDNDLFCGAPGLVVSFFSC